MTTIHLARHGATEWHERNRYAGSSDVALSETGREQARRLGAWAAYARITRLVSSEQQRAAETALAVAAATGLELHVDARLHERAFGVAEGRSPDEQAVDDPEAHARFDAAPASNPMPGGEPGEVVVVRALDALDDIVRDTGADGTALVVAHGTLLRLVLCRLLGMPLDTYRRAFPLVRNTAITTLRFEEGTSPGLLGFNVPV